MTSRGKFMNSVHQCNTVVLARFRHGTSIGSLRYRKQTVLGTLALGLCLALICVQSGALTMSGSNVYLYGSGGMVYMAAGYSIADSHVFDPDAFQIGVVDAEGNIWNVDYTSIIGYTVIAS